MTYSSIIHVALTWQHTCHLKGVATLDKGSVEVCSATNRCTQRTPLSSYDKIVENNVKLQGIVFTPHEDELQGPVSFKTLILCEGIELQECMSYAF